MKFIDVDAHENIGNLIPAADEILIDKKNKRIVVGDGVTPGGIPLAKKSEIINIIAQSIEIVSLIAQSVQLSGGTTTQGKLTWNTDEDTLDLSVDGVTIQLGQEFVGNVRNSTASTIDNGTPVMLAGTLGESGRILGVPMVSTVQANFKYILGVATEDIAPDEDGKVTVIGKVRGIDTTGALSFGGLETWEEDDILYLDPLHDGYLTNVEPVDPAVMNVGIAVVVSKHAEVGTIYVRTTPIDRNLSATSMIEGTPPTSVGEAGDRKSMIKWDADYVYVCTDDYDGATSIWARVAISTW
jgi:hypothetical protein